MKLDRNLPGNLGRGKYALIKLRTFVALHDTGDAGSSIARIQGAFKTLEEFGMLDYGDKPETEFFVMRIKDKYAGDGLVGYAMAAILDDPEYANEILKMAGRAGMNSPHVKVPD